MMADEDEGPCKLVSQIALDHVIESFCFMQYGKFQFLVVANSNLLSIIRICKEGSEDANGFTQEDSGEQAVFSLELLQSIHAFQKPIMSVDYDFNRKRVIAGGLDQQMKFFEVFIDTKEAKADGGKDKQEIE